MQLKENCKLKNTYRDKYYVLGEMIYFWRVIGYTLGRVYRGLSIEKRRRETNDLFNQSTGIKDEFNCCSEATTEDNINYLRICFERGYKPDLERPNALVKNGLKLVEGLFLGLNMIIPEFVICNNAFMKYWYECLGKFEQLLVGTVKYEQQLLNL